MASESILQGMIMGLSEHPLSSVYYQHNRNIICSLSNHDTHPVLIRDMFAVVSDEHLYRTQIFTFGNSYKRLDLQWDIWRIKFENILAKLYWSHAEVIVDDEIIGTEKYIWDADLSRLRFDETDISPLSEWKYTSIANTQSN